MDAFSNAIRLGMILRRLRNSASLAAAIVPFAIIVHLAAEIAAVGQGGINAAFVLRHSYFVVLIVAASWWFGSTVGFGCPASERRRRCRLLRAEFNEGRRPWRLGTLVGANLLFFALAQACEGVPIASGAVVLSLLVASTGSLVAALLVFYFGRSFVVAGTLFYRRTRRSSAFLAPCGSREQTFAVRRRATSAYRLFIPNRPPPDVFPI